MASQLDNCSDSVYIDCWCGTPGHVVKVSVSKSHLTDEEPFLELEYQLHPGSFWMRLRTAILYLFFPAECRWHGTIWDEDSATRVSDFINRYLVSHGKWKLKNQEARKFFEGESGHGLK